ncbi:MAG TPA: DUF1043 family protein [Methylophaga aminisulfidivorans]|uniref:Z-ring associated protein G n=2 Tax=root TaxID=1 RepID=A0A7C1ZIA4_9GAMM|nr:DUF1043 family protein [Methylophaga aminisulfidivorans]HEC74828.1 DUF1043 family protein [Methylophaga aminisulfidivorans]
MTSTEMWGILVIAVVIAALAGFVIGRRQQPGGDAQLKDIAESYDRQLAEKQAELDTYKAKVHSHYNKTAGVFKDMAGSYKELFDHLSQGYEELGNLSDQRVLPERAGALLDGPDTSPEKNPNFVNPNHKGDEDALSR